MSVLELTPGAVTLEQLADVYWNERAVTLNPVCKPAVDNAAKRIDAAAAGDAAVYGVNTGFGKLASLKIAPEDTATLQRNLILSHCCGVGEAVPRRMARLMMTLKLLSFGRGASGVRWDYVELLQDMLAKGVTPVIPAQGSVGASGDLAPLSHMTAVVIGEGEAEYAGKVLPGAVALAKAGLTSIQLGPKEGLAFINGTQFSTAFALAGLFAAWQSAQNALVISAMSTDAIMGSTAPLQPEIHQLRGQRGQVEAAAAMR
ncbi:MAG: aromatic amino acid lyase, partial [Shimia sp.]|uniref:aromatic amino acid lyase n=1 Tax=Shimia sp. TaxID=1954381 RepID=UPI0040591490